MGRRLEHTSNSSGRSKNRQSKPANGQGLLEGTLATISPSNDLLSGDRGGAQRMTAGAGI
jgi:hypothetical protein